jgi:glycosyltransferase involved in cell wall biosynthesis
MDTPALSRVVCQRVLFVMPSLNGGGAERAAILLARALPSSDWKPTIYVFNRSGAYASMLPAGLEVVSGDSGSGRLRRIAALAAYVKRSRPAVVVSLLSPITTYLAMILAGSTARFAISQQTPLSAVIDDADCERVGSHNRRLVRIAVRAVYNRADVVIAPSHGVADDLAANFHVKPHRICVIPNPVDLLGISKDAQREVGPLRRNRQERLIVTAGRLVEQKNLSLLIRTIAVLRPRLPIRALILGAGPQDRQLRALAAGLGVSGSIDFLGFCSNPWQYFAASDLFVLCSRYEGFGNVIVEAMACGLPVVMTKCESSADILGDTDAGIIVEKHEPEALAGAIEMALADEERRQYMSSCARARARDFDVATIARRIGAAIAQGRGVDADSPRPGMAGAESLSDRRPARGV